jgi:hypothetical protein
MFHKGAHFLGAAVLLHREKGCRDVVLHLLCQGLEIVQKGLLLANDYDKFKPRLKDKLGHDLVRGSDAVRGAYSLRPLEKEVMAELQSLNLYYRQHLLRYGTIHDVLHNKELKFEAVMRRAVALTRLGNKIFRRG